MPDFENIRNKENKLPWVLVDYFKSKQEFLSMVGNEYRRLKETHSRIDPSSFGFVEILIGKDEAYDLGPDERKMFIVEIKKAIDKIEKDKRNMRDHWGAEAERAGFIAGAESTGSGINLVGDGEGLERHLRDK